jgi:hypothetical protein
MPGHSWLPGDKCQEVLGPIVPAAMLMAGNLTFCSRFWELHEAHILELMDLGKDIDWKHSAQALYINDLFYP